jgi:methionyl-tRNA synthetase
MKTWVETKNKSWRPIVLRQVLDDLKPSLCFSQEREEEFKTFANELPKHKKKYARNREMQIQFESKDDLFTARQALTDAGIESTLVDGWAHRSISRDIPWGIPMPEVDPDIVNKTLYVWPDSLIAPIAFTEAALEKKGLDPASVTDYWNNPDGRIYQFLGQDNVFFYVLMQAAMWLGSQDDTTRLPVEGDLQMNEVFGCFHLMVSGHKMSKSRGNFYTAAQLIDEKKYSVDQIRYFVSLLGLGDKPADFDFESLDSRNAFLAGRMNAAFERPISAAHSKFGGRVPDGELIDKVEMDTFRMVQRYLKSMKVANYPNMLYEVENYARKINTLFNKYKPHDDRHPEEQRRNALYSAFYLLKSLMIMLYPFVPHTMERLRESLRLPESVWSIDELGTPIPAGHEVGPKQVYFPAVEEPEA